MKKSLIVALGLCVAMSLCAISGCANSTSSTAATSTATTSTTSGSGLHQDTKTKTYDITSLGSSTKAGDYVQFGTYPQGIGGTNNNPITWLVLTVDNGRAQLISAEGLDQSMFNSAPDLGNDYSTSVVKAFLEGDFKSKAFDASETSKLVGEPTLLSADEAKTYFSSASDGSYKVSSISSNAAMCLPTDYAVEQGVWQSGSEVGYCDWWLSTPSTEATTDAQIVNSVGEIRSNGCAVDTETVAVRPVIWVTL